MPSATAPSAQTLFLQVLSLRVGNWKLVQLSEIDILVFGAATMPISNVQSGHVYHDQCCLDVQHCIDLLLASFLYLNFIWHILPAFSIPQVSINRIYLLQQALVANNTMSRVQNYLLVFAQVAGRRSVCYPNAYCSHRTSMLCFRFVKADIRVMISPKHSFDLRSSLALKTHKLWYKQVVPSRCRSPNKSSPLCYIPRECKRWKKLLIKIETNFSWNDSGKKVANHYWKSKLLPVSAPNITCACAGTVLN